MANLAFITCPRLSLNVALLRVERIQRHVHHAKRNDITRGRMVHASSLVFTFLRDCHRQPSQGLLREFVIARRNVRTLSGFTLKALLAANGFQLAAPKNSVQTVGVGVKTIDVKPRIVEVLSLRQC